MLGCSGEGADSLAFSRDAWRKVDEGRSAAASDDHRRRCCCGRRRGSGGVLRVLDRHEMRDSLADLDVLVRLDKELRRTQRRGSKGRGIVELHQKSLGFPLSPLIYQTKGRIWEEGNCNWLQRGLAIPLIAYAR